MPLARTRPATAPSPSSDLRRVRADELARPIVAADAAERLSVPSPFDGRSLGSVPRSRPDDVRRAAARARGAQDDWAHRSFAERAEIFLAFHDRLLDRQDEILDLVQLESGKARIHAFEEVVDAAIVARYYALSGEEHLAPRSRRGFLPGLTQTLEVRHPKGLVGVISPWNYPFTLGVSDAIPALLAGNAVLTKPDLQTPFSTLWARELLVDCGLPGDLFLVVTGDGPELGPPLVESVDAVSFTGSTAVGRLIGRQAGERLVSCSLELGGKNSMLVLDDADLAAAVQGAVRGCFSSAGQLCISFERIYVHRSLYDSFVAQLCRAAQRLRLGTALDYSVDLGSLVSAKQLQRVNEHVEDARARGARVECGGRARPDVGPFFYEPTVLSGVTDTMRLHDEETFGPVVAVFPFESLHDAIERANATAYGLNASIWSKDVERARRTATRLRCGTVNVNEAYGAAWGSIDAPMGGFKDSGLGRRHGAEGIQKYTESQTIAIQRGLPLAPVAGVPPQVFVRWMTQALRALRRVPGLR